MHSYLLPILFHSSSHPNSNEESPKQETACTFAVQRAQPEHEPNSDVAPQIVKRTTPFLLFVPFAFFVGAAFALRLT